MTVRGVDTPGSSGSTAPASKAPAPSTPSTTGAPVGTGYDDAAWSAALSAQGIAPEFQDAAWNLMSRFSKKNPWATSTWFTSMLQGFQADPAHMAMYDTYGSGYLDIWVQYLVDYPDDPNWLQNQLMAKGYTAEGAAKNYHGPGTRGPGGGGGGATKAQQYAAAEAAIRNQASTLGYTDFKEPQIKALAKTVVDGNWSGDQLTDYLVTGATGKWDRLGKGVLTAGVDAIKAQAAAQLISISDETAQQWSKRMASGELDAAGLKSLIQAQAVSRYGWAADQINKGINMSDFLAPSRDRIAQILEIPPGQVDLMDPKFMSMVTVHDPKTGSRPASDTEIIRAARKDSRWASTANARDTLSSAAVMLRNYVEGH